MESQNKIQVTHPPISLVVGACNQKINTHQPRKSIARAEPEEHGDGGKRAAEYTDRLPATVHHLNTGLR